MRNSRESDHWGMLSTEEPPFPVAQNRKDQITNSASHLFYTLLRTGRINVVWLNKK